MIAYRYLRCSPEVIAYRKREFVYFPSLPNLLRSLLPYSTPTVAIFGPGLESETSGIFRKILMDDTGVFQKVGLTPGEFSGKRLFHPHIVVVVPFDSFLE